MYETEERNVDYASISSGSEGSYKDYPRFLQEGTARYSGMEKSLGLNDP
jgi:hypothetical protein